MHTLLFRRNSTEEPNLIRHVGADLMRQKREAISLTLSVTPGTGLAGTDTGIAASMLHEQNCNSFKLDID